MPLPTAKEYAEKLIRRGTQAAPDYVKGVQGVTESPTAKAAAKLDKAQAGYLEAIASGKMKRGLLRVDLASWISQTVAKGQSRYGDGLAKASAKIEAFATEFLPYLANVQAEVNRMPDMSFEDSLARMTANARALHNFVRK